jgi:hypothetical protein
MKSPDDSPKRCEAHRRESWWVNFAGSSGGVVRNKGPLVVVSNDALREHTNRFRLVALHAV